ncbi:hypothetical protein [Serratia fonticola]
MPLIEYIAANFGGNKSAFARHMGVIPQQVTKWVNEAWIVVDGKLYSPKRDIPALSSAHA